MKRQEFSYSVYLSLTECVCQLKKKNVPIHLYMYVLCLQAIVAMPSAAVTAVLCTTELGLELWYIMQ